MQASRQEPLSGPLPEMASHWAFTSIPTYRYIAFWLEATQSIDGTLFLQTVYHLLEHHEMLRLRVHKEPDGLLPYTPASLDRDSVVWVRLSNRPETQWTAKIQEVVEEIYHSLGKYEGQLSRFVYFDHGDQAPGICFFILHHALFDAYSSAILLRDFETVYHQLSRGEKPDLIRKTDTYRGFMRKIQEYLETVYYPRERRYWFDLVKKVKPLPVDFPENRIVSFNGAVLVPPKPKDVKISLSETETKQFYRYIPAMKAQVLHTILASLTQACVEWTGEPLYIQLMDAGRTLFPDLDLSRSIGCFSQGLFMLLELEKGLSPIDALRAITQQIQSLPTKGVGRAFVDFAKDQASEAEFFVPENILVNYFGHARAVQPAQSRSSEQPLLRPTERYQAVQQRSRPTPLGYHRLRVFVYVVEDKLTFDWSYDEQLYHESTIERLAQRCLHSLQSMITYSVPHSRR